MPVSSGSQIAKYVVREKIAEGGMAEIYLGAVKGPAGFEKNVAIKRIRPFLAKDSGFVEMFIAEAQLASQLDHPNLVQIFDFDKHDETYYLAMEYVRGRSLWEVRKRAAETSQPMSATLVAHLGSEVAKGLHYAHRVRRNGAMMNLVHRDVTPHNILCSYDGAVKLTDFGIAKAGAGLTAPGMLKGKYAYMSPEQSRGDAVDARTDVFALGVVLWELLTGARLFVGDSDVAVLKAVQKSTIVPPHRLNDQVPESLSQVVMRALERDVARRFNSAQLMERSLANFILSHARSVDETDLSGYLRKLYPTEVSQRAMQPAAEGGLPSTQPERGKLGADAQTQNRTPGRVADDVVDAEVSPGDEASLVDVSLVDEVSLVDTVVREPVVPVTVYANQSSLASIRRVFSKPIGWLVVIAMVLVAALGYALKVSPAEFGIETTAGVFQGEVSKNDGTETRVSAPGASIDDVLNKKPSVDDVRAPWPSQNGERVFEPLSLVPPRPKSQPGWLEITAKPWARVKVGNRHREISGTSKFRMPPGRYTLEFQHNHRRERRTAMVRPAESTAVEIDFRNRGKR